MVDKLQRENDKLHSELDRKDTQINELMEDRAERSKRHLQEIENLKLSH